MTQAHSLVICNGRLDGDKDGKCTYRAHPKKVERPKPPTQTPLAAPPDSGVSDDDGCEPLDSVEMTDTSEPPEPEPPPSPPSQENREKA
jgi:hypothetical protein